MKENTTTKNHLTLFIEKFEPRKFKMLSRGIEIRGNHDLYKSMNFAKDLIARFQLPLTVHHSAEMAMYGGFEVNYVTPQ